MFFINNVLMKPDSIEESVELLSDNIITDISRPFPNIDVVPEKDREAITTAMVAYIVNKTDIDYGQDGFRDYKRFNIITKLVGIALVNEINVRIPVNGVLFRELFENLLDKKFEFLFSRGNIINTMIDVEFSNPLSGMLAKSILDNRSKLIEAYNKISNS